MKLLPAPPPTASVDPLYNIGVVTRMTGITMATLRAWERRYDFPEAERTIGGHRLYSERDILRLRWVKERIEEGMQTAQAIQALRHQEAAAPRPSAFQAQPAPETLRRVEGANTASIYIPDLLNALLHSNLPQADQILAEALALFTPDDLIVQVIGPALRGLGEAWEHGRISVAIEHLGTNYLRQRLLQWMSSGAPPLRMQPILLACAPEEWHEGSLLILGALLRRLRFPVAYLGQAVPLPDLASFVREIKPSLVILVAMTEKTAYHLAGWPTHLSEAASSGQPPVCFGGRAFVMHPELQKQVAGIYLGDSLDEGLQRIQGLMQENT